MQTGILKPSELFFYSGSSDPGLFFYPLSAGHFFCTKGYRVQRDSFDSILILYVVSGSFSLLQNQRVLTAKAGQIALIDCFHPHVYDTDRPSEAYWIHISGSNTNELTEELIKKQGCILSPSSRTPARICELFELIKNREPISASSLSFKLYRLITELFESNEPANTENLLSLPAVQYIYAHYSEKITVADMAAAAGLSSSQFSRQFKRRMGAAPYEYLLSFRLSKAKELLKNTELPISEIAGRCGFGDESGFISFFKKQEGISPLKFRNILF